MTKSIRLPASPDPVHHPARGTARAARTVPPARLRALLSRWDRAVFAAVAAHHWPGGDRLLPRLSRGANHGRLWFAVAAAIAAAGAGGRAGSVRCAVRGVLSLALASATVNTVGKGSVRRDRPLLDAVPLIRQLHRQPVTTSFPSGHSASAAAFATGVALESRAWGAAVAPLAATVAFSRVYVGVHYPSDVLVGMALGAGAAFAVRGLVAAAPSPAGAQALPGDGGRVQVTGSGESRPSGARAPRLTPGAD